MDRIGGYLSKYLFEWDFLNVVAGGGSLLDSKFFVSHLHDRGQVDDFISGYGFDPGDPVGRAELFGHFQEALQFVRRYFLREGNPDGLNLPMPRVLLETPDVESLFLMAAGRREGSRDDGGRLWAEVVLKVMHTILHVDKDIRSPYFSAIQTQILDRFYKHLSKEDGRLALGRAGSDDAVGIIGLETKSRKTRDSVILKLLHKPENVAEELFDRIGIRIITKDAFDALNVIKFLLRRNVIVPHNVKPSRSVNTMIDLRRFQGHYQKLVKEALRRSLPEEEFLASVQRSLSSYRAPGRTGRKNHHGLASYRSIHFTSRQLITYRNPFFNDFNALRCHAREAGGEDDPLAKRILDMDISLIARDVRFFYPYEVQIVDEESHRVNTEGEASHLEYKKSQVQAAMMRLFKPLLGLGGAEAP